MAYRTFRDADGVEWHAWDVTPRAAERRRTERRRASAPISFRDRRRGADRRVLAGQWNVLRSGLSAGWLCFDGGDDRRRLTPIPGDWVYCPREQLESYCRAARPVRRVSAAHGSNPGRNGVN